MKKAADRITASHWLIKNHRDLIDAEFCLNEGGWGEMVTRQKLANDIQVSEKYVDQLPPRSPQQGRPQLAAGAR